LGKIKVWAERGVRPNVDQWKQCPNTKTYTVTVLTLLDDEKPLVLFLFYFYFYFSLNERIGD